MEDRLRQVENKVDQHGQLLSDIRDAIRDIEESLKTLTQIQVEKAHIDKQLNETTEELRDLKSRYDREVPSLSQWKDNTQNMIYKTLGGLLVAGVVGAVGAFAAI